MGRGRDVASLYVRLFVPLLSSSRARKLTVLVEKMYVDHFSPPSSRARKLTG